LKWRRRWTRTGNNSVAVASAAAFLRRPLNWIRFKTMHLIEIFLPLRDNQGFAFATSDFAGIRKTLTEKFGGLTAFSRVPADGTD
jgi:hypothetical protein